MTHRFLFLSLLFTALLYASCADREEFQVGGRTVTAEQLRSTFSKLCDFGGLTAAGQNDEAKQFFHDELHTDLHLLASVVAEKSRSSSARVLEAKQALESKLAGQLSPDRDEELVSAGTRLMKEPGMALAALEISDLACYED